MALEHTAYCECSHCKKPQPIMMAEKFNIPGKLPEQPGVTYTAERTAYSNGSWTIFGTKTWPDQHTEPFSLPCDAWNEWCRRYIAPALL